MDFENVDYDFKYLLSETSYVEDDCVNVFNNILHRYTLSQPCPMDFLNSVCDISPVNRNQTHIQLFYYGENYSGIGHWVCLFYNGNVLRIYDSLKGKSMPPLQKAFVNALFPHRKTILFPEVQAQSNSYDCGVFAIAYATSLALKKNPVFENFISAEMRPHLLRILQSKELMRFPSIPRKPRGNPGRDIFAAKNQKENQIIKAEPKIKMVTRNKQEIKLKEMERNELQTLKDRFEKHSKLLQEKSTAHRVQQFKAEYREFMKQNNRVILKRIAILNSSMNIVKQENHKIL